MSTIQRKAAQAVTTVIPFLSSDQLECLVELTRGEEGDFFSQKIIDLKQQIDSMPKTYEQGGLGDFAVAHLHYFFNGSHWYITEKDIEGGVHQATAYAILGGDDEMAELGYVSIDELTRYGVQLDLHFKPCSLIEIKGKRGA